MRPQSGNLVEREPEHEIRRKASTVTADLFVEPLGRHAIQLGKGFVEQNPTAAQKDDRVRYSEDRRHGRVHGRDVVRHTVRKRRTMPHDRRLVGAIVLCESLAHPRSI